MSYQLILPENPLEANPRTGIAVALYPGDTTCSFVIQRAPDSAGAPNVGAAVTLTNVVPGTQEYFVDELPLDGLTYWYRIAHTGNGDTQSAWTGWVSAIPRNLSDKSITRPSVIPPTWTEDLSEITVQGTLVLTVVDPQSRLDHVVTEKKVGQEPWDAPVTYTSSPVTETIDLIEAYTSKIAYQVFANLGAGVVGFEKTTVDFSKGKIPAAPAVVIGFDFEGKPTVTVIGDSDCLSIQLGCGASPVARDADFLLDAPANGRIRTDSSRTFRTVPGDMLYVKAVAYNDINGAAGGGAPSVSAYAEKQREGPGDSAPDPDTFSKSATLAGAVLVQMGAQPALVRAQDYVSPPLAGSYAIMGSFVVPPGITITSVQAYVYQGPGPVFADPLTVYWQKVTGTTISTVASNDASTSGWQLVTISGTLVVAAGDRVVIYTDFDTTGNANTDHRVGYFRINYTTADYTQTL